jgi:hypothetical protein
MFYFDYIAQEDQVIDIDSLAPLWEGMKKEYFEGKAMAIFTNGTYTLPLTLDAVVSLLRIETEDLHAVDLRKAELLKARNAFFLHTDAKPKFYMK